MVLGVNQNKWSSLINEGMVCILMVNRNIDYCSWNGTIVAITHDLLREHHIWEHQTPPSRTNAPAQEEQRVVPYNTEYTSGELGCTLIIFK